MWGSGSAVQRGVHSESSFKRRRRAARYPGHAWRKPALGVTSAWHFSAWYSGCTRDSVSSSASLRGQRRMTMAIGRREMMAALSAVVASPLAARAQQRTATRRVGVLLNIAPDDPESQTRLTAFAQGLQSAGWTIGQNVLIEHRWAGGSADTIKKYAQELVVLAPDVILAQSTAAVAPLLALTRTIPIVFTVVADPVGAGYVQSLAHPGGNATGFTG